METLKTKLYNKFYHDYISDLPATHPFIPSLSQRPLTEIDPKFDSDPQHFQKIKAILSEQNKDQSSAQAKDYLRYLEDPDSRIIITGQQLGLFASPLYTIYKLITTIKLAELLNSQKSNHKFIPVFWLETEDHDFQEINHSGIFNKNFRPEQIRYEGQDRDKVSIRHYQLEKTIEDLIDNLKDRLIETEFSNDLYNNLRSHFQPGTGWSAAARSFLRELFEPYGLLFFEPGDEKIKHSSIPFFNQLIEDNDKVFALFNKTSEKLQASGYHNQVKVIPGQTYIHIENDSLQRMHLYRQDELFGFKDEGVHYSLNETIKKLQENPLTISTTVISRPLLQSWLLPVAAYVAGPGEIAYWAQLGSLFDHFKLDMPYLYPRISATIVEPKIKRYLMKYAISPENLLPKKGDFIDQYYKNFSETEEDPLDKPSENFGGRGEPYN